MRSMQLNGYSMFTTQNAIELWPLGNLQEMRDAQQLTLDMVNTRTVILTLRLLWAQTSMEVARKSFRGPFWSDRY